MSKSITSQPPPQVASKMLSQRMADELMNMSLEEAMPLTRALGHYLNLTSIAELHHRSAAVCMGGLWGLHVCMHAGMAGGLACMHGGCMQQLPVA